MVARYTWNRVQSLCREAAENAILGAELRDVPGKFSYRDATGCAWELPASLSSGPVPGLSGQRNFLGDDERSAIVDVVRSVRWQSYESSTRRMAPVLFAAPDDDLRGFEVFGNLEPELWLDAHETRWAPLRRAVDRLATALGGLEPRFAQLQELDAGALIMPHIDAASPRADVVATIGLEGGARIRVAACDFTVAASDVYVLADYARWDVKHEVRPSLADRLSVTIRFVKPPDR